MKKQRFVRILHIMYDSQAWKALSTVEKTLYLELVRYYNGHNNGDIYISCRDAAKALRVSPNTAARSFKGLVEHGFIAVTRPSAFNMKQREATRYRLTCECVYDGNGNVYPPTNEWKKWDSPQEQDVQFPVFSPLEAIKPLKSHILPAY